MRSPSQAVRLTTINWGAAIVIVTATLSCDSIGTEPNAPAVRSVPAAPRTPQEPEGVPDAPMVPIMSGQIVFLDPYEGRIFIADRNGHKIQRVSGTSGAVDLAVSPDGKSIAFSRNCDSLELPCSQMYIMSVDGIDPLLLQTGDTRDWPGRPAWSPDGKRIAFVQGAIGPRGFDSRHIYTINADGSGLTQLTHTGYNEEPSWSRDGKRIIFARSEDDSLPVRYGIFEMDPDGSNEHLLRSGFRDHWPTSSPDGSLIAFIGLNPEDYRMNLFVMKADGSGARVLKSSLDYNERPAWSPDGKTITFVVRSSARMCEDDDWVSGSFPCGQSARRVGVDALIDPTWEVPSASYLVWQR